MSADGAATVNAPNRICLAAVKTAFAGVAQRRPPSPSSGGIVTTAVEFLEFGLGRVGLGRHLAGLATRLGCQPAHAEHVRPHQLVDSALDFCGRQGAVGVYLRR